ncbi:hypothetical protein [Nocardia niigatensis]|uniref:hypothetical protein n=1 Tax=Nocardia niigatensis TaxID=209249 RepID=UPI0002F7C5C9|nr:hypothetical protein [Nocardia niigatensis]
MASSTLILATTLIGTPATVRRRLQVWNDVGVDTVRLYPAGDTLDTELTNLARALDRITDLERSPIHSPSATD